MSITIKQAYAMGWAYACTEMKLHGKEKTDFHLLELAHARPMDAFAQLSKQAEAAGKSPAQDKEFCIAISDFPSKIAYPIGNEQLTYWALGYYQCRAGLSYSEWEGAK